MILYRVLQGERPARWDFLSHEARGVQPRGRLTPLAAAEWTGISSYATVAAARTAARYFRLGAYIAELDVPEDGRVAIAQALRPANRDHFTIWTRAEMLMTM